MKFVNKQGDTFVDNTYLKYCNVTMRFFKRLDLRELLNQLVYRGYKLDWIEDRSLFSSRFNIKTDSRNVIYIIEEYLKDTGYSVRWEYSYNAMP